MLPETHDVPGTNWEPVRTMWISSRRSRMEEGVCREIEYVDAHGVARMAWFDNTDVRLPTTIFQQTHDPFWFTRDLDGTQNISDWLYYLTSDGAEWRSKLHCHYGEESSTTSTNPQTRQDKYATWFEHERPDGSDNRNDSGEMIFLDWSRRRRMTTRRVEGPFPKQPEFDLRHYRW